MLIHKTVRVAVLLFAIAGTGAIAVQAEARPGVRAGYDRHVQHRSSLHNNQLDRVDQEQFKAVRKARAFQSRHNHRRSFR